MLPRSFRRMRKSSLPIDRVFERRRRGDPLYRSGGESLFGHKLHPRCASLTFRVRVHHGIGGSHLRSGRKCDSMPSNECVDHPESAFVRIDRGAQENPLASGPASPPAEHERRPAELRYPWTVEPAQLVPKLHRTQKKRAAAEELDAASPFSPARWRRNSDACGRRSEEPHGGRDRHVAAKRRRKAGPIWRNAISSRDCKLTHGCRRSLHAEKKTYSRKEKGHVSPVISITCARTNGQASPR